MKKLILFFVFLLITATASAKDYSLSGADLTYTINSNGTVHVREEITYKLNGCFRELYLEKPPELPIMNARGYCKNAECTFRIDEPSYSVSGYRELILSLDSGGCNNIVTAVFDYDVYTIRIYKDTAQFYYKLWGERWKVPSPVTARINLPGPVSKTTYYVHSFSDHTEKASGNSIIISSYQPANRYLEINLLMPLEWFENRGSNVYSYDYEHSKSDIIKIEEQQMAEQRFWKSLECLLFPFSIFLVLSPFIALPLIYYFFGREYSPEQVGYLGEYEREPPSKNPPAEAPFFIDGEFSPNSLPATIIHLVYKGYLDIVEDKAGDDILLVPGEGKGELTEYEKSLLDYINSKMENKNLSMKKFRTTIAPSWTFYAWFEGWKENVKRSVDIEKNIDYTGYKIAQRLFKIFVLMDFLIAFGIAFFFPSSNPFASDPLGFLLLASTLSFVVWALVGATPLKKKIWFGRWNEEGRLLNLKWNNFKKYLSDFTLLKEHPPSSVKLWDYYMSYAVAFGVAEKTAKAMKVSLPEEELRTSRLYPLYHHPIYFTMMRASFIPSYSPPSRSSGGIGGFGGGAGGGGGGAR